MSIFANKIQGYPKILKETHPAVPYILAWLDAQVKKDYDAFCACFGSLDEGSLYVSLPEGLIMREAHQLFERHKEFYAHPNFRVRIKSPLQDGIGNQDFFTCSVLVHVTLPDGKERTNYIDMTFFQNCGSGPKWIPGRLVNTVVTGTF